MRERRVSDSEVPPDWLTLAEIKFGETSIAKAVDRSKVRMFWSPNGAVPPNTIASIGSDWRPGADYVDIVGMNNYPESEQTFSDAFGEFYDT